MQADQGLEGRRHSPLDGLATASSQYLSSRLSDGQLFLAIDQANHITFPQMRARERGGRTSSTARYTTELSSAWY